MYWLHRLAGPRIQWRLGLSYGAAVAGAVEEILGSAGDGGGTGVRGVGASLSGRLRDQVAVMNGGA